MIKTLTKSALLVSIFALTNCSYDEAYVQSDDGLSEIGNPAFNEVRCSKLVSEKTFRRDELGEVYEKLMKGAKRFMMKDVSDLPRLQQVYYQSLENEGVESHTNRDGEIITLLVDHGENDFEPEVSRVDGDIYQNLDSLRDSIWITFSETYNTKAAIYSPNDPERFCEADVGARSIERKISTGNINSTDNPTTIGPNRTNFWPEEFTVNGNQQFVCSKGIPEGYYCEDDQNN